MSALLTAPAATQPKLLTAVEFFEKYGDGGYELIDGVVTEVSMPGAKHGKVALKLGRVVGDFVETHGLGHGFSHDTLIFLERDPDTMRGPDLCFVSYARLPAGDVPDGPLTVIPELVFEVRSPSDSWTDVVEKVLDYLRAGVAVIVVLDPTTTSATVFRPDTRQDIFTADQTLTIPDVLPGFEVAVGTLFG